MELLDYRVCAAALTNFSLRGNGFGAAHNFQMEDDDYIFDLSDYFNADDDAPPPPTQPELAADAPMVSSFEQNLVPPAVMKSNIRQVPCPFLENYLALAYNCLTRNSNLHKFFNKKFILVIILKYEIIILWDI